MLVLVSVALTWFVWLRPAWLGGPLTFVRVTGDSMEPGMFTGDLAIVRADASYDAGEVVAFRVPQDGGDHGPYVIHRIVRGDEEGLTLRGDNNEYDDPWHVRSTDVAGQLWLNVPDAGSVISKLADPVIAATLLASLTAFLVILGGPRQGSPASVGRRDDPARRTVRVG